MANFNTHFTGAAVATTLAASTTVSMGLVNSSEVVTLWFLGVVGGLLPDIDSDDSSSLRLIFNIFGLVVVLFVAMAFYPLMSIVGLWFAGALAFAAIRYVVQPLFEMLTVHRGSLHSILAMVMFALLAVHISALCGKDLIFSWLCGIFILFGGLVHLTLDELYSVDLAGMEFKRSFGSALKPLSIDYPVATGAQVLAVGALIWFAPSPMAIVDAIQWADLQFLPLQEWQTVKSWVS